MKVKSSTWLLVLAALLLGTVAIVVAQQPAPKSTGGSSTVATEEQRLYQFEEADIQTVALQTQLRTLKFERNADGTWQMTAPEKTRASDPSLAFLLDLVATGKSQRTITAPASDREQFGLHQPMATIEVTLKDKTPHKLIVGGYDFNRSALYAQADPPADANPELKVLLVSPNFDNAVNRPLEEWKQPATAEKSPGPSPGASPSPSPSSSPAASPSPSPSPAASPAP